MITFPKETLTYDFAKNKEWIVTNGLGGYASSTLLNCNTRKYHALLMSSLDPPVKRYLQLAKLEETARIHKDAYSLSTNHYPGTIHPEGHKHLEQFIYDVFPTFTYNVQGNIIKKSITMPHGYNATIITYKFITKTPYTFTIQPLVNARPLHTTIHAADLHLRQHPNEKTTTIKSDDPNAPIILLGIDKGTYTPQETYIYNMEYEHELERGYDYREDHWVPGTFSYYVQEGVRRINILAVGGTQQDAYTHFDSFYQNHYQPLEHVFDSEKARARRLIANTTALHHLKETFLLTHLITASDMFIVHRNSYDAPTVIAGYHWFPDYGRDALISFPGLFLIPGRFDEARAFLKALSTQLRNGLLPNTYIEIDNQQVYNSADASLWFIVAIHHFYRATGDIAFIRKHLWPAMQTIIAAYENGTDHAIKMDQKDCLLNAGTPMTNLTWMDAQSNTTTHTPRHGKAVEINALWYNAHKIMESFAQAFHQPHEYYTYVAHTIEKNFLPTFWNPQENILYDVVREQHKDPTFRPNQIFAISLPYPLLPRTHALRVIDRIKNELLTPYGLRSLSPNHPDFQGKYEGNVTRRDKAYHNGTAWNYLLGPFLTAYLRIHNTKTARAEIEEKILPRISDMLLEYGIGTVSEIHDGNPPYTLRGCISQAWSVAELLRAYAELKRH